MSRAVLSAVARAVRQFPEARRAAAAVEFVLIAPVFLIIMAGAADYGRAVYTKFTIENAVSTAANYALVNATSVNAAGASTLATTLATILSGNTANVELSGVVTINNGSIATLADGTITKTGTAASADSCYCPTKTGTVLAWGAPVECGKSCGAGGALAGKFVEIKGARAFTPFFSNYGIAIGDRVTANAVVQVQ